MYSITVQNASGEYVLHNSYDETLKLNSPVLNLELNKSGTLTFGINPDHPNKNQILPMASEIYVYDDDQVYWIGRPLSIEEDFDLMADVTCEGILGYLLDTQMTPFDYTGDNSIRGTDCVRTFISRLISNHNARVGSAGWNAKKRFSLGDITVRDSNNNLARSSEEFKSTLETINEKLLETHGGYFRVRVSASGSTRYIDYVETLGAASQPIMFGDNLLDLSTHTNAESIYTCVIPLGAEIGDTGKRLELSNYSPSSAVIRRISELAHGGAFSRVSASSLYEGIGYISDASGVNKHGRIYVVQTWDDVTIQENLALKAAAYIGAVSVLGTMIELTAVDLAQIDADYNGFRIGEMVQVVSLPHNVQADYQITQMQIDLYNPANSNMVLGGELGTFTFENTKQTAEITNQITEEVSSAVQNATALLSGGLGGYLIIRQDDNGQPYEILIMNAATESAATRCVRINQNGIGFGKSAVGSTAWTYRNAWTIDGNLVADFITTGTLNASLLKTGTINADLIKSGTINASLIKSGTINADLIKSGSINASLIKTGAINASLITTGTLNANLIKTGTINANLIKAGVLKDAAGNTTLNMATGVLTMKKGSINLGGKFKVSSAGAMAATSGTIGGLTLSTNRLYNSFYVEGRKITVGLSSTSMLAGSVFYVRKGSDSSYTEPFAIQGSGALTVAPLTDSGADGNTEFHVFPGSIQAQSDAAAITVNNTNGVSAYSDNQNAIVSVRNAGVRILPGRSSTAHSGNLYITTAGEAYRANEGSSSRKIKHDIKPVENDELDPKRLYDVEIIQYKYNDDFVSDDDPNKGKDLIGFIVEDLDEIYPAAVSKEDPEESKTWMWSPIRMIPGMLQLIQNQKKEIDSLKERLDKMEHAIELLTKGAN